MIFIHHHQDTEREEKPPQNIRRIALRVAERGGQAVANEREQAEPQWRRSEVLGLVHQPESVTT